MAIHVLGIDPGSHHTGWGIVSGKGSSFKHIASGTVHAPRGELPKRLLHIADALDAVIAEHNIDAVAVERVFLARNTDSALKLGHARGVALLCAARAGVEIAEYSATEIKQAVTGRGRAAKEQVQTMVQLILGLNEILTLDTSDALAAAICHAQRHTSPTATRFAQERKQR